MSTRTRLLSDDAPAGSGHLVAPTTPGATDGIWFVVEVALPKPRPPIYGLVGTFGAGTKFDEALVWYDATDYFRGGDWFRGSNVPGGRYRVGAATIELDNSNSEFSRWATAATPFFPSLGATVNPREWYGPGALVRIGLRILDAGPYLALFTGLVETWTERSQLGGNLNRAAIITAAETTSLIANAPGSAVATVGAGETIIERAARILAAADWPFPTDLAAVDTTASLFGTGVKFGSGTVYSGGIPTLAGTDLSAVRLAELYLAAEASWCYFHAARDGSAKLTYRLLPTDPALATDVLTDDTAVAWIADLGYSTAAQIPFLPGLDLVAEVDDSTRNIITLARPGGSDITTSSATSIARIGPRAHEDRTLPLETDAGVTALGALMLAAYAWPKLRVTPIEVDSKATGLTALLTMVARRDLGDQLPVTWQPIPLGERLRLWTRIQGERHRVTANPAGADSMQWRATYDLDNHAPNVTDLAGGFDVTFLLEA